MGMEYVDRVVHSVRVAAAGIAGGNDDAPGSTCVGTVQY